MAISIKIYRQDENLGRTQAWKRRKDTMELPLFVGKRQMGTVGVDTAEGETLFTVAAPQLTPGLWRITLRGAAGEVLLGVTETGTLRRRLSRQILAPAGKLQIARADRGGGEWHVPGKGEIPGRLILPDGARCCRRGRGYLLALPWEEGRPFPMAELFCLARLRRMEGRNWAVFTLNEAGEPMWTGEN